MGLNEEFHLTESQMKSIMCMVINGNENLLPKPIDSISIKMNQFAERFSKEYTRR